MNNHKNSDVRNNITICEPIALSLFEARYDNLLREGNDCLETVPPKSFGYDELRRTVNRLEKHKTH